MNIYLLNEWRGLMLIVFFGILSFGFFKLKFLEFVLIACFAILGYCLIIFYIYSFEPQRMVLQLEILQLLAFTSTILVKERIKVFFKFSGGFLVPKNDRGLVIDIESVFSIVVASNDRNFIIDYH